MGSFFFVLKDFLGPSKIILIYSNLKKKVIPNMNYLLKKIILQWTLEIYS
jgi:hypothetical protein